METGKLTKEEIKELEEIKVLFAKNSIDFDTADIVKECKELAFKSGSHETYEAVVGLSRILESSATMVRMLMGCLFEADEDKKQKIMLSIGRAAREMINMGNSSDVDEELVIWDIENMSHDVNLKEFLERNPSMKKNIKLAVDDLKKNGLKDGKKMLDYILVARVGPGCKQVKIKVAKEKDEE